MSECSFGVEGCGKTHDCWQHERMWRKQAFDRLTPEEKYYDRCVDPLGAYHTDFPSGCSCHINPPCSFCVDQQNAKEVGCE